MMKNIKLWDETVAKRGPSEIGSCLFNHLKSQLPEETRHVSLIADNCPGQNRNRFLMKMLAICVWWILQQILSIELIFLTEGHTQNEIVLKNRNRKKLPRKTKSLTPLLINLHP